MGSRWLHTWGGDFLGRAAQLEGFHGSITPDTPLRVIFSIFDEILAMSKKVTSAATIGTLRLIDNQHFFWEEGDMSKMLESQISLPSYLALLSPIVVL